MSNSREQESKESKMNNKAMTKIRKSRKRMRKYKEEE